VLDFGTNAETAPKLLKSTLQVSKSQLEQPMILMDQRKISVGGEKSIAVGIWSNEPLLGRY